MEQVPYYMRIRQFSLWNVYYAFMDTERHFADGLFIKHQVRVHSWKEYEHRGQKSPYHMIVCGVRKKDEERFLRALDELPNKMMLCGYPDYMKDCNALWKEIIDNADEDERKRFGCTGGTPEEAQ